MSERPSCLSMGVEEEFLLVHPSTGQPHMDNVAVIEQAKKLGVELQLELDQCQVETTSSVCWAAEELRANLMELRTKAADAARQSGCRLMAVGVPLVGSRELPVTDKPRYRQMERMFGLLAHEQGICGCHVHVGVPDREAAIQVSNHLRPWLPALLALTANSPIHRAVDTGYASWRSILWSRWPSAGPPPFFASAQEYDRAVHTMMECGSILDDGMVYWDVRPSAHFPTVEVRVSDVPATVRETVLLATLVRALVLMALWAVDRGEMATAFSSELVRAAYWRAAHDGLTGSGIDMSSSRRVPSVELLEMAVRHARPALDETGDYRLVIDSLREVLAAGNGAIRQRCVLSRRESVCDVVALVERRTVEGCGVN